MKIIKESHSFFKTENDYTTDACTYLYEKLQRLQTSHTGPVAIALSGGSTPLPVLELLKTKSLDWERFNFFIVDERFVPLSDPQSNFNNIESAFFSAIPSKKYSMYLEGKSAEESVMQYEKLLHEKLALKNGLPFFDLILLGLGEDGHTASLFPATAALNETAALVVVNVVPQLNTTRLTLTYPVLLNAGSIIVMAKGATKHKIIEELYAGAASGYPMAKIIDEYDNLEWLTD